MNILGYKIAYTMGVSSKVLDCEFKKCSDLVQSIQYFIDKPMTKLHRVLADIYFKLVKRNIKYVKDENLVMRFESILSPVFKDADLSYKKVFGEHITFYDFLGQLTSFYNSTVSQVYHELKPGISLEGFQAIIGLKVLTPQEVLQYNHLLLSCYTHYGVFFRYELLNAEQGSIFSSDEKIRVLACKILGFNVLTPVEDGSILADIDKKDRESVFFSADSFSKYNKVVVCREKLRPSQIKIVESCMDSTKEKFVDLPKGESVTSFVNTLLDCGESEICVVTTVKNTDSLSLLLALNCDIVVGMPTRKPIYVRILSGDYKRVFLLSSVRK